MYKLSLNILIMVFSFLDQFEENMDLFNVEATIKGTTKTNKNFSGFYDDGNSLRYGLSLKRHQTKVLA